MMSDEKQQNLLTEKGSILFRSLQMGLRYMMSRDTRCHGLIREVEAGKPINLARY